MGRPTTLMIPIREYEAAWRVYHRANDLLTAKRGWRHQFKAKRALSQACADLEDATREPKEA